MKFAGSLIVLFGALFLTQREIRSTHSYRKTLASIYFLIAVLAFVFEVYQADIHVSAKPWIALGIAICALPIWYLSVYKKVS